MDALRDPERFPADDNGDVLWRMRCHGDDLSRPREIEFFVIFPQEDAALRFAVALLREAWKVSMSPYEHEDGFSWQVGVYPVLEPTHAKIDGFEKMLEARAADLGGRNNGWGCFQQD